jgi:hypothetical protein
MAAAVMSGPKAEMPQRVDHRPRVTILRSRLVAHSVGGAVMAPANQAQHKPVHLVG